MLFRFRAFRCASAAWLTIYCFSAGAFSVRCISARRISTGTFSAFFGRFHFTIHGGFLQFSFHTTVPFFFSGSSAWNISVFKLRISPWNFCHTFLFHTLRFCCLFFFDSCTFPWSRRTSCVLPVICGIASVSAGEISGRKFFLHISLHRTSLFRCPALLLACLFIASIAMFIHI